MDIYYGVDAVGGDSKELDDKDELIEGDDEWEDLEEEEEGGLADGEDEVKVKEEI